MPTLYTIGFTRKTAQQFFTSLEHAQVSRVIDVRLNNRSQLAGFSKATDLPYFLRELIDCDYLHRPDLAPTATLLDAYKKKRMDFTSYSTAFRELLIQRKISDNASRTLFSNACLLCSEATAEHCHRRLVAEHLCDSWPEFNITHLG